MKRIALLMVLMIVLSSTNWGSVLAGQPSQEASAASTEVAANSERLHLSVLGRQRSGITFEEVQTINAWQVLMDMFAANNLELSFNVVEGDQYATVLNATIASGDLPDFMHLGPLSDADCINLIESGFLMNINDALEFSNGVASGEFDEGGMYNISRQMYTYTDGGMYLLGQVSKQLSVEADAYFGPHAIEGNNPCVLIRQDWLDKLDLPMPTTTAELLNTLIAFQENDMNGNGQPDERIVLDYDSFFNGAAQWFGLAPFMFQLNRLEGTAANPIEHAGFVPYIQFLQECIDAGVMQLGDDVSYYNGGLSAGDSLGVAMQENSVAAYLGVALADHALQPEEAQYKAMPLLEGVPGIEPVALASSGYKAWGRWGFSSEADPKAVAAFLDTICTQEYAKWVTFGVEGETYHVDETTGNYVFDASNVVADILETKTGRGYMLVIDSFLPDASQIGWYQEYKGLLNWESYSDFTSSPYFVERMEASYKPHSIENVKLYCEQAENASLIYNFNIDVGMVTTMITLEEADTLQMYEQDFNTFWPELVTGYLTGNYAIADYESHLEQLRSMGMDEIKAVRQAQFDRFYGR
jgi:ABC-type glycerol-3-phosphate transport system substrate-binding protein